MNTDNVFLVARISVDTLSDNLDWVTSTEGPYQAFDPIDLDEQVLDTVFEMYIGTYSEIDKRFNIPEKYGLFEYNRWLLIEDNNDNLLGFVLLKTTAFGIKIGLTSSDRSEEGKRAVRGFHEKVFFVDGVYAEVSDAMERIVTKKDAPRVQATDAQKILAGKLLEVHEDGYHYTRPITGIGDRLKLMVGKPKL